MLDALIDFAQDFVQTTIDGLMNNPDFREGFIMAVFWLAALGLFAYFFRYVWDRVSQFFRPTQQRVTINAGEVQSGFASFLQFVAAALIISVVIAGFVRFVLLS